MNTRLGPIRLSITIYLAAMAAAILVPLLLFVALLLLQLEQREHAALERRAVAAAIANSTAIERQLRDMATTLNLLSTSPELMEGDLRAFHNRTQAALAGSPWFIIAVDRSGQQLLNTRVPFGTPLGPTSDLDSLVSALESGRVEVSPTFFGRTSGKWVFNVIQPLAETSGGGAAALIMTQNAEDLSALIATGSMPSDWFYAAVDQNGQLVAANDTFDGRVGAALFGDLQSRINNNSGVIDIDLDGEAGIAAYSSIVGWSWRSFVWGPVRSGQASILESWGRLFVGGIALSVLSALAVLLLAFRLRRAIRQLSRMARKLGAGEIVSPAQTGMRETDLVAYALTEASFDRAQSEERTHFILRELVHRTKNMLAVVQSMMRQTARQSDSLEAFLPKAGERLEGFARSIDLLTEQGWAGVSLNALIRRQIATFVNDVERVVVRGEPFLLKPDAVQNLGMAFHELGTNAVKYGALSVPQGRIDVRWTFAGEGDEERIAIEWAEQDGPPVKETKRRGFGTTVLEVHAAAAIGGTVALTFAREGLRWRAETLRSKLEWRPDENDSAAG
ncbi:histidine kinase [Nitratireductor mangrovi]|uniref:histidine kinase n=1 Tax=Nitratireductor mangrovi TaxID=2599600 RepID=A0A5B8KUP9_9HYPH|nr:sensor histidine kinase [Nitratireductor mangrovi]QDY99279.1 histidine kinase [Nitratireductor mangrovi]